MREVQRLLSVLELNLKRELLARQSLRPESEGMSDLSVEFVTGLGKFSQTTGLPQNQALAGTPTARQESNAFAIRRHGSEAIWPDR